MPNPPETERIVRYFKFERSFRPYKRHNRNYKREKITEKALLHGGNITCKANEQVHQRKAKCGYDYEQYSELIVVFIFIFQKKSFFQDPSGTYLFVKTDPKSYCHNYNTFA